MSPYWNGGPQRCRHDVIEPHRLSDTTIEYWCRSCGEVIGSSVDLDTENKQEFVTGKPRELTDAEKEKLA